MSDFPEGMGMWFGFETSYSKKGVGKKLVQAKVEHAFVECLNQNSNVKVKYKRDRLIDDLLSNDIRVLPWAHVNPGEAPELIETLSEAASFLKEDWVVPDAEGYRNGDPSDAEDFVKAMHERDIKIAVTAFGRPWLVPAWQPWLKSDVGLLQLADIEPKRVELLFKDWMEHFPQVVCVAEPYEAKKYGWTHKQVLDAMPIKFGSISTWWYNYYTSKKLWDELASFEIRGRS